MRRLSHEKDGSLKYDVCGDGTNHFPERWCRYYAVSDYGDGRPCLLAKWPDGRREIIAVFLNTEEGHDHAEALCEMYKQRFVDMRKRAYELKS